MNFLGNNNNFSLGLSNSTPSLLPSAPQSMQPSSTQDAADLLNQAKQDISDQTNKGINQDDLDNLSKHQHTTGMMNMFMNMVAAATNVDAKPYTDILNKQLDEDKQNLGMKQQLASKNLERAQMEQNLGMNQLKANQALNEQQVLDTPLSTVQKGTIAAAIKLGKIDPTGVNLDNMTVRQYNQVMGDIEKLSSIQSQLEKAKLMNQLKDNQYLKNPWTGDWELRSKSNPNMNFQSSSSGQQPQQGQVINNSNTPNQDNVKPNGTYTDIVKNPKMYFGNPKERDTVLPKVEKLQQDYQSNFGKPDLAFKTGLDTVNELIDQSQKGNYKAANAAAVQAAKLFEGLGNQRLTNMDIQLSNDPSSSGYYNTLTKLIQGVVNGGGNITPKDAQMMRQVSEGLKQQHENMISRAQENYMGRAKSYIPAFNDNTFLFGNTYRQKENSDMKPKYKSIYDILK